MPFRLHLQFPWFSTFEGESEGRHARHKHLVLLLFLASLFGLFGWNFENIFSVGAIDWMVFPKLRLPVGRPGRKSECHQTIDFEVRKSRKQRGFKKRTCFSLNMEGWKGVVGWIWGTILNLLLGYIFRNSILEALKKCLKCKRTLEMLEALQNKFRCLGFSSRFPVVFRSFSSGFPSWW